MTAMNRREAIGTMGAMAGLGLGTGAAAARGRTPAALEADALGWDAGSGTYVLPDLPYAYDALQPHIDATTMRIHHEKHHQGYVNGLNTAVAKLAEIRGGGGDPGVLEYWLRRLSFNAGGHVNHTLFWANMAPPQSGGGGEPGGALMDAIRRDFGSYAEFEKFFRDSAASVEGSGWAWLVRESVSGRLMVVQMHNQQDSLFAGTDPLLGVDVWEHAYYLNYQNRRADYLLAFMKVVNWGEVSRRFEAAGGR
tara:strand:+ start:12481 stop:13233 length:753 start_codon:yes stop_codon:yes gene_type:complete